MTLFLTLVGTVIIVLVLIDIFQTLFHPSASGALSSRYIRFIWRGFRRAGQHRPELLALSGPVSLLLIIVVWVLGLVLGWALILWPRMPEEILYSIGLNPDQNDRFLDAIYLSTVTLGTLGYGEMTPTTTSLRLIAPLEALVGFALFTAAISWILSVYPVLARRRNLARFVTSLQESGHWQELADAPDGSDALNGILLRLSEQVTTAHDDYVQFPITYYFHQDDPNITLEIALPRMTVLADEASRHSSTSVRFHARVLQNAIRDLTYYLGETFLDLHDATVEEIYTAYARDHLREVEPKVSRAAKVLGE